MQNRARASHEKRGGLFATTDKMKRHVFFFPSFFFFLEYLHNDVSGMGATVKGAKRKVTEAGEEEEEEEEEDFGGRRSTTPAKNKNGGREVRSWTEEERI